MQVLKPEQSSGQSCLIDRSVYVQSHLHTEPNMHHSLWGYQGKSSPEQQKETSTLVHPNSKNCSKTMGAQRDGSTGYAPRECLLCSWTCKDLNLALFPIKDIQQVNRLSPLRNLLISCWHYLVLCLTFSWTPWNNSSHSFMLLPLSYTETHRHKCWALYTWDNTSKAS